MKIFHLVLEWKISIYIFCMGYITVTKGSKHKKKIHTENSFFYKRNCVFKTYNTYQLERYGITTAFCY